MTKCGIISIVGKTNAGKSTLTNSILGKKISIVSPKVQTTRTSIKGILTHGDTQLVLIDTPGIFDHRNRGALERSILKSAWNSIVNSGTACIVIDAHTGIDKEDIAIIQKMKDAGVSIIAVINKIDLVKKEILLLLAKKLSEIGIADIFMISAISADGVKDLKEFLLQKCPQSPWIYDKNQITDAPAMFLASEITREKIFLKLHQEVPYSSTVRTDSYQVVGENEVKISQTILVLKENHKGIVIGKEGAMLKEIGSEARKEIRRAIRKKVHLFLFVKVDDSWIKNPDQIITEYTS